MKLSADRASAKIDINGEFDAGQLDTLLRKLALVRAEMTPAVPDDCTELADANNNVLAQNAPGLFMAARHNGGFTLWLRHSGYGWLIYHFDSLAAAGINNYLTVHDRQAGANLVSQEVTHRH